MKGRVACLVLCLALGSGCAHRVTLLPAGPAPSAVTERAAVPLVVESVLVTGSAGSSRASDAFVNRIVMELRRTRGFTHVLPPSAASSAAADAVRVRMELVEHVDERYAPNIGKAVAVGLSLLLLAPVFEFEMGYAVDLQAQAVTCDDWMRELRSQASGELGYRFLSSAFVGQIELVETVIERALSDVVAQLASDRELRGRVESLVREGDCRKEVLAE